MPQGAKVVEQPAAHQIGIYLFWVPFDGVLLDVFKGVPGAFRW